MLPLLRRRLLGLLLVSLAICMTVAGLLFAFTLTLSQQPAPLPPLPALAFTPSVRISPTPVLTAAGQPPRLAAKAAYLLDMETGNTLVDWHGELPLPMASTTKIMTALLAIQSGRLDRLVTVKQDAFDQVSKHPGASTADLRVGDRIPLGDLLYGLLLPSGNDAAIAIANTVGGSRANFVHMMNVEAYRLRLFSTHFTSPDGLIDEPEHYTTAYDLARLAGHAMRLPLFAKIVSQPLYTLPRTATHKAYTWTSTNKLLDSNSQTRSVAYSGATGVKTGHTLEAGFCLVFSATRAGHHLLGVLLNETDPNQRFREAGALLDWGFALPLRAP